MVDVEAPPIPLVNVGAFVRPAYVACPHGGYEPAVVILVIIGEATLMIVIPVSSL